MIEKAEANREAQTKARDRGPGSGVRDLDEQDRGQGTGAGGKTPARPKTRSVATKNSVGAEDGGKKRRSGLDTLRGEIDRVDREVVRLLSRRRRLAVAVVEAKDGAGAPLRDTEREEDLLGRVIAAGQERGLDAHFVTRVFHEVIDDSLRAQAEVLQPAGPPAGKAKTPLRVAFQGVEGAYSHLAAQRFYTRRSTGLSFAGQATFAAVVEAVEAGRVDAGILPIENTTSGAINEVYDLLLHTPLAIVGEVKLRVDHCLIGIRETSLSAVRVIVAHPQAALQCSQLIASLPGCRVQMHGDTAESVVKVKADDDPAQVAIASAEAAHLYGLVVLKAGIADQRENSTRFVVVARQPQPVDPRIPCKTSLVIATGQQAGALVDALLVFREHGINLARLESRPIPDNPWEEMFYLDFEGNTADPKVQATLDDLGRKVRFARVLGSYPSDDLPPTRPRRAGRSRPKPGAPDPEGSPAVAPPASSATGYRLASRTHKAAATVVEVKGARIGGDGFVVIAGPCAVESIAQVSACARAVREHGGHVLRGGCFKPRSSPYSFQGLGWEGLELLAEAGRSHDLPVITEVLAPADVGRVAWLADILQIGARNMQNFPLLREVGRQPRPVLLKRGMMASIEELLQAAEYILAQGNQQVILCERGIRTFETATRNTLDLSAIPILNARTHLPVLVDPSHAAGERSLVPHLARAAKAVGAHGIMVEIHPTPEKALSDGAQSLTFSQFAELMEDLVG